MLGNLTSKVGNLETRMGSAEELLSQLTNNTHQVRPVGFYGHCMILGLLMCSSWIYKSISYKCLAILDIQSAQNVFPMH